MRAMLSSISCGLSAAIMVALPTELSAQQVTVSTPFVTTADSYFEQIGVNWGLNFRNGFVRFGGANPARAPFGNPQGGGGFNLGFGGPGGFINFRAAQGSQRSIVSQKPSLTLQNGVPGSFHDTSISPFVVGHVPVVGGAPAIPYSSFVAPPGGFGLHPGSAVAGVLPVAPEGNWRVQAMRDRIGGDWTPHWPGADEGAIVSEPAALNLPDESSDPRDVLGSGDPAVSWGDVSSAARAAPSLAEARRMRQAEEGISGDTEARRWFERGITAEQTGKPSVAAIYYRMALRRADAPLRGEIEARLAELTE